MKKKDKIVLGIGLFAMVLTIIIGTSFAYWKLSKVQEDQNIIATGCFNVEFTEGDGINLQNAFPISDEEGLKTVPYTFTIKNTCDDWAAYQINLETLSQASGIKVLPDEYVRANLQDNRNLLNTTLTSGIETETTIDNATKAYKLYEGMLKAQEEKTYNLRIWMDKDTPAIEEVMNAFYSGKITIEMSYRTNTMKNAGTLRITTGSSDKTAFYNYRSDITKIVFQNEMNPIETDLTWDVSDAQDGSVMSYLVPNEDDTTKYTLYIQGDGGIYANLNSSYLFYSFTNLASIEGLEYLDTSKVTNMSNMFSGCRSLTSLDLSNFDTSNVTDMSNMFYSCRSLTSLDLSNFDTSQVTNMYAMFGSCSNLISLDLSRFDTSNVTNMSHMFSGGYDAKIKLINLDLSTFDTAKVTDMSYMFLNCNKLTNLNVSTFDTSQVSNMSQMFSECSGLTSLDLSNFDTSSVTNMSSMFYNCSSLTNLNVSTFDTSKVTKMNWIFSGCGSLTSLNLSNFNTSNVTDMSYMFSYCYNLASLDLSSFNTSSVTNMGQMFRGCNNLINLDLSNFDTSNVTDMNWMFADNHKLENLDIKSFDTSKVTKMNSMFARCSNLANINLSTFDTSNVTSMQAMFSGCRSLTSLNLSNFNTSNVTDMSEMFYSCGSLIELNLSNFDFDKVEKISLGTTGFLTNCTKVITIINIKNNNITSYTNAFMSAATTDGAQITINYTEESSDLVDQMIATKSSNSNVVKGSLITE